MRKFVITMLSCGGIALWSAPTFAQFTETAANPRNQETFCYEEDGPASCVPSSEQRFEACANLAVERGERVGGRGFDRFVYECLSGTIGTAPK